MLNPRNLKLPFWLFNFEEIVDVFFAGRPGVDEEVAVLAELIPQAKSNYTPAVPLGRPRRRSSATTRRPPATPVDTPVPYRLADLVALIDERMGKLENRSSRMVYHKLITRIETVRNDPRYAFMFDNANVGGDTMGETLRQLFRLPADGKPMTIMQLAGFPAEVVELGRVGAVPHGVRLRHVERRRVPAAVRVRGSAPLRLRRPHRSASARPARRSRASPRKAANTACSSALVTQRPAELDSTIISQCSTLFAMRMANERDQAIVRSAVSDAAANLLAFVPSLGTREVLAFGEGVALPTRLKFKQLPENLIPQSQAVINATHRPGQRDERGLHRHDHRPLARRDDEPQAERARRRSGFRIAGARRVLLAPGCAAGAERCRRRRPPRSRRRAAARSRPVQAVEAADRRAQRRVRQGRAGRAELAEVISFVRKIKIAGARPSRTAFAS